MSKTPADKSIDEQTFEALEDALKLDLDEDSLGALDDISIEELENKVSSAARELKSAGENKPHVAESKSPAAEAPEHRDDGGIAQRAAA